MASKSAVLRLTQASLSLKCDQPQDAFCGCMVATKSAELCLKRSCGQPQDSFCNCLMGTNVTSAALRLTPKPTSVSTVPSLKIPSAAAWWLLNLRHYV